MYIFTRRNSSICSRNLAVVEYHKKLTTFFAAEKKETTHVLGFLGFFGFQV